MGGSASQIFDPVVDVVSSALDPTGITGLGQALTGREPATGVELRRAERTLRTAFSPDFPEVDAVESLGTTTPQSEADVADAPFRSLFRRSRGNRAFRIPLNRSPGLSIPSGGQSSLRI